MYFGDSLPPAVLCSACCLHLKMELICSSDTSVYLQSIWCYDSHGHTFQSKLKLKNKQTVSVRFEVFKVVTMKNGIFWDVALCGSCKNRHVSLCGSCKNRRVSVASYR
jgi:hypothetical protein